MKLLLALVLIVWLLVTVNTLLARERPFSCLGNVTWLADYYRHLRPNDNRWLVSADLLRRISDLQGVSIWDSANQRFDVPSDTYLLSWLWGFNEVDNKVGVAFYASESSPDTLYMLAFDNLPKEHPCSAIAVSASEILPYLETEVGLNENPRD